MDDEQLSPSRFTPKTSSGIVAEKQQSRFRLWLPISRMFFPAQGCPLDDEA
jgi:hypothetical protein